MNPVPDTPLPLPVPSVQPPSQAGETVGKAKTGRGRKGSRPTKAAVGGVEAAFAGRTFRVGGEKVTFSPGRMLYFDLYRIFRAMATTAGETAREDYLKAWNEGFRDVLPRFVLSQAQACAKKARAVLKTWGCRGLSEEAILEQADLQAAFAGSTGMVMAAGESLELKLSHRQMWRELKYHFNEPESVWGVLWKRGKIAVQNSMDEEKMEEKYRQFLASGKFVETVCGELGRFIGDFPRVVARALEESGSECRCEAVDPEEERKVLELLDNLLSKKGGKAGKRTIQRVLGTLPCHAAAYVWAFDEFGDEDGGLAEMAKTFGVDGFNWWKKETLWLAFSKECPIVSREGLEAARAKVAEAKRRAGITTHGAFNPLVLAARDLEFRERVVAGRLFETREEAAKQRTVYGLYASSGFLDSAEACAAGLVAVRKKACELGVDAGWLLEDMETASRRHAENGRVRYGYLWGSDDEWREAERSEELFFRALWARVKAWAGETDGAILRESLNEKVLGNVRATMGVDAEDFFVLVNTGGLAAGRTGLVFTGTGVAVGNGSAMAAALADHSIIGKLLFAKARDFLDQRRPKGAVAAWADILGDRTSVRAEGGKVRIAEGVEFEGTPAQAEAVAGLIGQLKQWAAETGVGIGRAPRKVPLAAAVREPCPFTPWPALRTEKEGDFWRVAHVIRCHKDDIPVDAGVGLPADGASPDSFTWGMAGGRRHPDRPVLCHVKRAKFWSHDCAALTPVSLLIRNAGDEKIVRLTDIVGLAARDDALEVTTRQTELLSEIGIDGGFHRTVLTCPVTGKGWLETVLRDVLALPPS